MNNKKAFTVVELVIVIAIIAILAAVLIPTFASMVRSANVSADTQLIKNLNTSLRADLPDGKHPTMHDALKAAEAFGYDVDKINASAVGNEILWDQRNDVFCYVKGDEVIYIPESVQASDRISDEDSCELWKIYNAKSGAVPAAGDQTNPQTNSIYLGPDANYSSALDNDVFNVTVGIDVGNQPAISSIKYENTTNDGKTVVIRTNGGTLTVNAPNDTVSHYGFATVVNVNEVDDNCYNENGTVGRLIYSDNDGKIYFGDTAVVYCYMNTSTDTAANAEFPGVKAANAIVYTYVDSGEDEAKGYAAADNKEDVTVTDGIVEISTCFNHNEDYDIIYIGDDIYIICKCCGAFSRISTDANGTTTVESSEGIGTENQEHETNEFAAKNNSSLPIINAVATIGYTKYYSTLAAAVADAKDGDTIVMLKDDTLTATVIVSKTITIDLNGKTVGRSNIASAIGVNGGNLTINDSAGSGSIFGNGQAVYTNAAGDVLTVNGGTIQGSTYGLRLVKGNTVTINGGNIIGGSYGIYNQAAQTLSISNANISGANAIKTNSANSNITITDSTLTGSQHALYTAAATNITITDSTLTGSQHALYTAAATNITIDNAMLYAPTCVYLAKGSHLELNGGSINATNSAILTTSKDNVITINSGTVSGTAYGITSYYNNQTYYSGTITINGGSVSGQYGIRAYGDITVNSGSVIASSYYAIAQMSTTDPVNVNGGEIKSNGTGTFARGINSNNVVNISGGTISADYGVAAKNAVVSGGVIIGNKTALSIAETGTLNMTNGTVSGGVMGLHNSGASTISGGRVISEGALDETATYAIYHDVGSVTVSGTAEIVNNNSYAYDRDTDKAYVPYGVYCRGKEENNVTFTMKNGGSISAPNGYALDLYHADAEITDGTLSGVNAIESWTEDSTCKISSGTFNATGGQVCYAYEGFFTIYGGTFTGGKTTQYEDNQYRFALNCYDSNYTGGKAGFTVKGGSFYQFNPSYDLSEGENTCFTPEGYHTESDEETGYYTVVENN